MRQEVVEGVCDVCLSEAVFISVRNKAKYKEMIWKSMSRFGTML